MEYIRDPVTNMITGTKAVDSKTGYSDIFLSDFVSNFQSLYINKDLSEIKQEYAATGQKENPVSKEGEAIFDRTTYLNYANAFKRADYLTKKTLSRVSSDSPEFTAMQKKLAALCNSSFYLESMKAISDRFSGKDKKENDAQKDPPKEIKECCEDYLRHCKAHPKRGGRRAKRVKYARATLALLERMEKGEKDPVAGMKREIAERFLQNEINRIRIKEPNHALVSLAQDQKEVFVNAILKNAEFKKALKGKDVIDLGELCKNEPKELRKALKEVKYVDTLKTKYNNMKVGLQEQKVKRSKTITANDKDKAEKTELRKSNTFSIK